MHEVLGSSSGKKERQRKKGEKEGKEAQTLKINNNIPQQRELKAKSTKALTAYDLASTVFIMGRVTIM